MFGKALCTSLGFFLALFADRRLRIVGRAGTAELISNGRPP
jgi:hypothetical protein